MFLSLRHPHSPASGRPIEPTTAPQPPAIGETPNLPLKAARSGSKRSRSSTPMA